MSEHKFKPFEKVLVRDTAAGDGWRATFFSHYSAKFGAQPVAIGGWMYGHMIPYEGNERLLGTTDWPEPKLKKGDTVLVWDDGDSTKKFKVYSHYDGELHKHVVFNVLLRDGTTTESGAWDHAEKFVPATVETQGDGHTEPG